MIVRSSNSFFQNGRLDAISEVRILQHCGQWTKEKRASWIKQAVANRERLSHAYPWAHAYFAGRISALKSNLTADFSPEQELLPIVDRPLKPSLEVFHPEFVLELLVASAFCLLVAPIMLVFLGIRVLVVLIAFHVLEKEMTSK